MDVNIPNLVVETYSRLVEKYDDELNQQSDGGGRIEGQFVSMPPERKDARDREVRKALSGCLLKGYPYNIHCLHLMLKPEGEFPH
jgi:hypothetical protein